jgi:hypothetical protein
MQFNVSSRPKQDAKRKEQATALSTVQLAALSEYLPSDSSLRHAKIKAEVRKGNVEHILPMVALKARATLEKLPKHIQVIYDLDDLIAEGIGHAATAVLKGHSPKKSAGYITYLWKSLDNLYKDKLKQVYAEKRYVKAVYSLENVSVRGQVTGREMTLLDYLSKHPDKFTVNEERLICRIDAERAFIRLYSNSSPRLRRYLIMWLLQPKDTKLKKYGKKFNSAKLELRKFGCFLRFGEQGPAPLLSLEHCRCIWRDSECRRSICRILCRRFRTGRSDDSESPSLRDSLEGMVVKIALANSD